MSDLDDPNSVRSSAAHPLVLVPTRLELNVILPLLESSLPSQSFRIELCGFGGIAAAARTSLLIARERPPLVLLAGIAGSLGGRLEIGSACEFHGTICDGIGVGAGPEFLTAEAIGWHQWSETGLPLHQRPPESHAGDIGDRITLNFGLSSASAALTSGSPDSGADVLGVCAAAANSEQADGRASRFPTALAEDMESFGVAFACRLCQTPVRVIRGISNHAGDRSFANWDISGSLAAAADLAVQTLRRWNTTAGAVNR